MEKFHNLFPKMSVKVCSRPTDEKKNLRLWCFFTKMPQSVCETPWSSLCTWHKPQSSCMADCSNSTSQQWVILQSRQELMQGCLHSDTDWVSTTTIYLSLYNTVSMLARYPLGKAINQQTNTFTGSHKLYSNTAITNLFLRFLDCTAVLARRGLLLQTE